MDLTNSGISRRFLYFTETISYGLTFEGLPEDNPVADEPVRSVGLPKS